MSQKVTILSEQAPQSGQKHRSSNNFTTADFRDDQKLTFKAFYNYGMESEEEAKEILFDVWVDKTGKDPEFLNGIKSGQVAENTHHRNLYIANPRNATGSFTVEVSV
jgi:hypothetical protein